MSLRCSHRAQKSCANRLAAAEGEAREHPETIYLSQRAGQLEKGALDCHLLARTLKDTMDELSSP